MLKMVSFHIQAHLNEFLQILVYCSQSVDVDGFSLLAYSVFQLFDCARCICVHFALQQIPEKEVGSVRLGDRGGQMFFFLDNSVSKKKL